MINLFKNLKTFLVEAIGLVGGLFWAIHSKWDYEPVILVLVSSIGLTVFIILRFLLKNEDRPYIQLELRYIGCQKSNPRITTNSLKNEGGYFITEEHGKYFFIIQWDYQLIIRNNSNFTAFEVHIKVNRNNVNKLNFINKHNYLDPILIDKPEILNLSFEIKREMLLHEAHKLYSKKYPTEIQNINFLIECVNESRDKKYYSIFKIPRENNSLSSKEAEPLILKYVEI